MAQRTVVQGGRVADGTGMPSFTADVEITEGRITGVGRIDPRGAQVIDADGLTVAPGFIDIHTHYDAQLHFEPTASPSSWHGVTTVAIGNCGFSLAPCRPEDVAWTARMLSRVEGMSEEALAAGVTFAGGSMADFLGGLDGAVGINVMAYVGHCAVRRLVMGEAASERAATADEIAHMARVVTQALDDGAIGLSTSQLDMHVDHEGRPVPSNLATPEELIAISEPLGRRSTGAIEFFARSFMPGVDDHDRDLLLRMAEVSRKPIHGNILGYFAASPDGWRRNLAVAEEAIAQGLRYYPMLVLNPKGIFFALDNTFIFDEYPRWRAVLTMNPPQRDAQLRDLGIRALLAAELADPTGGSLALDWDDIYVVTVTKDQHATAIGRSITALAVDRGVAPLDAMLDLALDDGMTTVFAIRRRIADAERAVIDDLVTHPLLMPGSSDGGAHLQTFCGADYTTRLLTEHVPERLTLEQAVSKLTLVPATSMGLWDRGLIRPGMAGDLVLFDPDRLAVGRPEMRHDFPTGAGRIVFGAEGYHSTIVNGETVVRDGEPTGARSGTVIRNQG